MLLKPRALPFSVPLVQFTDTKVTHPSKQTSTASIIRVKHCANIPLETFPMKYQHWLNIRFTSEIFCNEMPSLQKYSLYIGNICLYYRNIGFTSELFAVKRLTNVGFTLKILPMKCKYCKNICFIIRMKTNSITSRIKIISKIKLIYYMHYISRRYIMYYN